MSYRLRRGLGYSLQDLISAFPGQEDCSPFASDCVARQTQRMAAINALWVSDPKSAHNTTDNYPVPQISWAPDQSAAAVKQFMGNQDVQSGQVTVAGAAPQTVAQLISQRISTTPVTAVGLRPGQLTFATSRGGTALQVGDTWTVSITGASSNIQVSVSGSGPGGPFAAVSMGQTDANGNFSKSGSVSTGEVGSWQETWSVGSAVAGSFSFTVAPATTQGGKVIITSGPSTGGTVASTPTGFDFSKIPWWGWAAGVGVAFFAFGGARGR